MARLETLNYGTRVSSHLKPIDDDDFKTTKKPQKNSKPGGFVALLPSSICSFFSSALSNATVAANVFPF